MKKNITFLLLFISIFPLPLALAFQRTDKMPSFFMPQNAVSTTSRTERSPLAERIRRQEEQRRLQEEALKNAELKQNDEEQKITESEQPISPDNNNINVVTTTQNDNPPPTPLTTEKPQNESASSPIQKERESVQNQEQTPTDNNVAVLPTSLSNHEQKIPTPENIYERPIVGNVASYKRIKEEHEHDLNLISTGKYIENPRLKNVLSEFKNEEHTL